MRELRGSGSEADAWYVPRIGLGAMPLSTSGRPDRREAIATIHAALDAGVRMIDTADAYCLTSADTGHNEVLIADAVAAWEGPRNEVIVATKGGHVRDDRGGWHTDGRPEHLLIAAAASRRRLGGEPISLYYFHRPDPSVPFERSVEALAVLRAAGEVRNIGLSNVDVDQLELANHIVPVAAVQNSFSPYDVTSRDVLRWCDAHRVGFVAWAPLGGSGRSTSLGKDPCTAAHAEMARERGVSVARIVLAWILAQSSVVSAIPGARRPASIVDAVAARQIVLSEDDLARLDGDRPQRHAPSG